MIKNVILAKRILFGVGIVLAVAAITVIWVDWANGSTSMSLELVWHILLMLVLVAGFVRSLVNRESASTRYLILAVTVIFIVLTVLSLVHHPTWQWP
jgi:hypothetical protein